MGWCGCRNGHGNEANPPCLTLTQTFRTEESCRCLVTFVTSLEGSGQRKVTKIVTTVTRIVTSVTEKVSNH